MIDLGLELHAGATDHCIEVLGLRLAIHATRSAGAVVVRREATPVEVELGRLGFDVLGDANAPDRHVGVGYAVDGDAGGAIANKRRRVVATRIGGAPIGVLAVLAEDRGVTEPEPVLGDTGLDQPLVGIFIVGNLSPVSGGPSAAE